MSRLVYAEPYQLTTTEVHYICRMCRKAIGPGDWANAVEHPTTGSRWHVHHPQCSGQVSDAMWHAQDPGPTGDDAGELHGGAGERVPSADEHRDDARRAALDEVSRLSSEMGLEY